MSTVNIEKFEQVQNVKLQQQLLLKALSLKMKKATRKKHNSRLVDMI